MVIGFIVMALFAVLFFGLWLWAEIAHASTQSELEDLRDDYVRVADTGETWKNQHLEVCGMLRTTEKRITELEKINEKLLVERAAIKAAISDDKVELFDQDIQIPEPPKFAVGDKVEVLVSEWCDIDVGDILVVQYIDIDGDIWAGNDDDTVWFRENELRKVG